MGTTSKQAQDGILLVIPDIPPTPGSKGLTLSCRAGKLVLAEGSEHPLTVMELDEDRARLLHEAIGKGLSNRLCIPPPPGKPPGWLEETPSLEEAAERFQSMKESDG